MSTIRHPVQIHAWWYAAAAALLVAGLLAVLMTRVFVTSGPATDVVPPPPQVLHAGQVYTSPCFPSRPGGSVELSHVGCPAGRW